jgi:hypothetical protein
MQLTSAKSKESLSALYDLTIQRTLDISVVRDLEHQLKESCVACNKLTMRISNRVEKLNCYKESGSGLSSGQSKTSANEKHFVMWFKKHNTRIRAKLVQIRATIMTGTSTP